MNDGPKPNIRIRVDPANPGQFFACCGLLELADRIWNGAEGWFDSGYFCITTEHKEASLFHLLDKAKSIRLISNDAVSSQSDEADDDDANDSADTERYSPSFEIVSPFSLILDWWKDKTLKTWAGSMDERNIFIAMCNAIDPQSVDPLNQGQVVFDVDAQPGKILRRKTSKQPKEPYYFDARRAASALSLDIGFATDPLKKKTNLYTVAYPVVEAMCFIGLQRCRPKPTNAPRVFDYFTWRIPLPVTVVPIAIVGCILSAAGFRFKNVFRTTKENHKAYNPATPIQRR